MKKLIVISSVVVAGLLGLHFAKSFFKGDRPANQASSAETEGASYWTCPMHPQIHSDKPGECPICHMKLVQVKAQGTHTSHATEQENRAMVSPTSEQLQLSGIQKITVEKMDLTLRIPISGRLLSQSTVAFQVYESDIRYVKPGLKFRGQSSFHPEPEIVGVITSVDSIVDPTSRTVRVVGQIKDGPRGLISETTFSGQVDVVLKGVTAVPESSVLHTGSGDIIYMIHDDGSFMAQPIKLGQKSESYYEVVDGLTAGQVISSGRNFLIDSEAKIRGVGGESSGHTHY